MTTYSVTKTLIRHEDFSTSQAPETRFDESLSDFVYTGCLFSTSASLIGTISAGTAYVNGKRIPIAQADHTFAASKDTYVDLSNAGVLTYLAVNNNASSPELTANSIRLCRVVTSGAAITSVSDMRNLWSVCQQNERELSFFIEPQKFEIDLGSFGGKDNVEIPVFVATVNGTILDADLVSFYDVDFDGVDYATLSLRDKGSDGTADNVIASIHTQTVEFVANDVRTMGAISATHGVLLQGDVVTFKYAPTGGGPSAGMGPLLLRFSFMPEIPLFVAPHTLTLKKITIASINTLLVEEGTNYTTVILYNTEPTAPEINTITSLNTVTTPFTAFTPRTATLSYTNFDPGEVLSAKITNTGTGAMGRVAGFVITVRYVYANPSKSERI